MFFQRLLLKIKMYFYPKRNRPRQHKPERKLIARMLADLPVELFNQYTFVSNDSDHILLLYPTIEEYINALKYINNRLSQELHIRQSDVAVTAVHITLDDFFLTKEGHYADVNKSVSDFKQAAMLLCKLMEQSDTAEYGVHENNLRMLAKHMFNIESLTYSLQRIALES